MMKKTYIAKCILIFGALTVILYCNCRKPSMSEEELHYKQWAASSHAKSGDSPEKLERMNKTGCAHCHTAQGYWEVVLKTKTSSAPYDSVTGLTCHACHLPGDGLTKMGTLRVNNTTRACTGCHTLMVQNDAENLEWCPQGSVFHGTGGIDFTMKEYPASEHSRLEKHCVSCHMVKTPEEIKDNLVGGHTFRVMTKGSSPRILNDHACKECHESITVEWIEESQAGIKKLLDVLAELLPMGVTPSEGGSKKLPKFPEDPSLNNEESRASFNYWMIVKDGSYGVHNPVYTKKLLKESIEALSNTSIEQGN